MNSILSFILKATPVIRNTFPGRYFYLIFVFLCFKGYSQSNGSQAEFKKLAKFTLNQVIDNHSKNEETHNSLPWLVMVRLSVTDRNVISAVSVEGRDTLGVSVIKKIKWQDSGIRWNIFADSIKGSASQPATFYIPLMVAKRKGDDEQNLPVFTELDVERFFFREQLLRNAFHPKNVVVLQLLKILVGESVR